MMDEAKATGRLAEVRKNPGKTNSTQNSKGAEKELAQREVLTFYGPGDDAWMALESILWGQGR